MIRPIENGADDGNLSRRSFMAGVGASLLLCGCTRSNPVLSAPFRMQTPWVNDAEFIGYFVAIQNGYYKDGGLNLLYQPGGPDVIAEGTLLSNRAELALTPVETTVNLIVRDKAPLKIIGTQYQKSPLGIVSLAKNHIVKPGDLVGKTLAVPPANVLTVEALLKLNKIEKKDVKIVPYQYDPTLLLKGQVDATVDFVTNVPFSIKQAGGDPTSFLIYDFGFRVYNDTVVVAEAILRERRADILTWLRASRRGWEENFKDVNHYPPIFQDSFFKGTGRTVENEKFFNGAQKALIESPNGIFTMSEDGISANVESLQQIGIKASKEMFVPDLAKEI
jgi:ABC-type nitrate/sulfonate/bicarbonate transport system substrate-binding protein